MLSFLIQHPTDSVNSFSLSLSLYIYIHELQKSKNTILSGTEPSCGTQLVHKGLVKSLKSEKYVFQLICAHFLEFRRQIQAGFGPQLIGRVPGQKIPGSMLNKASSREAYKSTQTINETVRGSECRTPVDQNQFWWPQSAALWSHIDTNHKRLQDACSKTPKI